MAIKNYTTSIDEHKSVAEIQSLLGRKGARQIQIEYGESGEPSAVAFALIILENPYFFRLPRNTDGVLRALTKKGSGVPYSLQNKQHAARVSWRILKDWIDAQMAIVEAEQAEMAEVFLPYMVSTQEGTTMYQRFLSSQKLLAAPSAATASQPPEQP